MGWLSDLFGKKETSGSVAKQRLQMVLVQDRSDVTPGVMELIKDEIIEVLARHLSINPDEVMVTLTQTARESRLVAEVPILNDRKRAACGE